MPAERVPMRDAREIIRLKFSANVATREIARRLGMAPSTVRETLKPLASAVRKSRGEIHRQDRDSHAGARDGKKDRVIVRLERTARSNHAFAT
jgi:hypothetical protein